MSPLNLLLAIIFCYTSYVVETVLLALGTRIQRSANIASLQWAPFFPPLRQKNVSPEKFARIFSLPFRNAFCFDWSHIKTIPEFLMTTNRMYNIDRARKING